MEWEVTLIEWIQNTFGSLTESVGKVMSFILFGILFVDVCIFTILVRGLWKVHRFIKRAEMEFAEDREPSAP